MLDKIELMKLAYEPYKSLLHNFTMKVPYVLVDMSSYYNNLMVPHVNEMLVLSYMMKIPYEDGMLVISYENDILVLLYGNDLFVLSYGNDTVGAVV